MIIKGSLFPEHLSVYNEMLMKVITDGWIQ